MQRLEHIMGMPILVNIVDTPGAEEAAAAVFDHFTAIDERFSTYKPASEISRINRGLLPEDKWSAAMREVFRLCEQTKQQTNGYFDIVRDGERDPSGLVKGWAIQQAADIMLQRGISNFYIDAGGDIQTHGLSERGEPWRIGVRNPFNRNEVVKVVTVSGEGVATSGTAIRGQHIYNPHRPQAPLTDIVSLTVVGPTIYDADRFATAAFAMGQRGITFIDSLDGFEGYMIDHTGQATLSHNFERYAA